MNPVQLAQQLKHLLEQARWPSGSAGLVFGARGSVAVFAGLPTEEQIPAGFPWCLVSIDGGDHDPDEPALMVQRFSLVVSGEAGGDRLGEHAIIGGATADIGTSANKGVAEVAARARYAVESLTGADGCKIQVSGASTSPPQMVGRARHFAMQQIDLSAMCTSEPHFSAPQRIRHVNGKWRWEGSHCAARFDFLRYRLVRKSGSTPSQRPEDGTLLYTGADPEFTGTAQSGQVYTVFADYNGRGAGGGGVTVEGSSSPEVGSWRTV